MYDQETIGRYLNVKIPRSQRKMFTMRIRTSKKKKDWGSGKVLEKNLIEGFFKSKRIPLSCHPYFYDKIDNHKKFILDNLRKGNDIIFAFHWKGMGKKLNWGHVCVVAGFDESKNVVLVGDPGQNTPKFRKMRLAKIVHAMHEQYDGDKRGFFIIGKKGCV